MEEKSIAETSKASHLGSPTSQKSPRVSQHLLSWELERTETSTIEPYAFFISWHGVLTLAFSGFTPSLVDLKQRITALHSALPPEAPGSLWPKTTIGCLRDGVSILPDQFQALNELCKKSTLEFFRSTENTPQIAVDAASVTIYECRSLERLIFEQIVPFQGIKNSQGPIPEEKERVKLLIGEADEPNYYEAVIKPGNRTVHYRGDAVGATLVHPLLMTPVRGYPVRAALKERGMREIDDRHRLIEAIEIFRQRVDGALPGLYTWFDDTSLHITLRAITR